MLALSWIVCVEVYYGNGEKVKVRCLKVQVGEVTLEK